MKFSLTIGERLNLIGVLPAEGNFATLKLVRNLRETLSLEEDEIKKYGVVQKDGLVHWNKLGMTDETELELSDFGVDLIKKQLRELDETSKLGDQHVSIYEKFIDGGGK